MRRSSELILLFNMCASDTDVIDWYTIGLVMTNQHPCLRNRWQTSTQHFNGWQRKSSFWACNFAHHSLYLWPWRMFTTAKKHRLLCPDETLASQKSCLVMAKSCRCLNNQYRPHGSHKTEAVISQSLPLHSKPMRPNLSWVLCRTVGAVIHWKGTRVSFPVYPITTHFTLLFQFASLPFYNSVQVARWKAPRMCPCAHVSQSSPHKGVSSSPPFLKCNSRWLSCNNNFHLEFDRPENWILAQTRAPTPPFWAHVAAYHFFLMSPNQNLEFRIMS